MNIGQSIITLPTVKPKLYAGKTGIIAVKNEDEVGVLIAGRVVWFLEKEIEEMRTGNNYSGARWAFSSRQQPRTQERAREWTEEELAARESGPLPGGWVPGPPQSLVTKPPSAVPASERRSPPSPVSAAPGGSGEEQELILGERGPSGGVVAQCQACGGLWERPKQRGRPALKCEECR